MIGLDVLRSRPRGVDRRLDGVRRRAAVDRNQQLSGRLEPSKWDAIGTERLRSSRLIRSSQ